MTAPTTQLSLRHLRGQGFTAEVVEHWKRNPVTGRQTKHDLFGFVDILALGDGEVVAVQTTTTKNVPAHIRKIARAEHLAALQRAGVRLVVHGWSQPNGPGTRWHVEEVDVACPTP